MDQDYNSSEDKSGVNVVVRIRPPNQRELRQPDAYRCVRVQPFTNETTLIVETAPPTPFTFDHVAGPASTQREMYERCALPIVESCLDGYNGTIFCYGQTGAGKTFTMIGPDIAQTMSTTSNNSSNQNHNNSMNNYNNNYNNSHNNSGMNGNSNEYRGLIPRILEGLFLSIEQRKLKARFEATLQVSCLEIYNEKITDLLLDHSSNMEQNMPLFNQPLIQRGLQLREDVKQGVYVEDLSHHIIRDSSEGMHYLRKGLANRHVGSTKMNDQSSRSHSVYTITIQSKCHEESGLVRVKTSYLHLIDLAGSERQQSTQTEGDRLAEACSINKSLSILGSVINSLVEKTKKRNRHVPYRDSKLTYLLRDSLGGNSKTCIVANISASSVQLTETISTLRFARRAKCIKNRPVINESDEGSVPALQQQIVELRRQLEDMQYSRTQQRPLPSQPLLQQYGSSNQFSHSGIQLQQQKQQQQQQPSQSPPQIVDMDEEVKQQYEERIALLMQRIEQSEEIQDHLYDQVEQFASVIKGKDMMLHATRLALKLKECELARREMREPKLGKSLLQIDYLDDMDDDDSSDDEMDEDEFGEPVIKPPMTEVEKLDRLVKKIWHPDRHPTVVTFAMENYELRERLQKLEVNPEHYEQEKMLSVQRTDAYMRELQRQIVQLVKERHDNKKKKQSGTDGDDDNDEKMEESNEEQHQALQEQIEKLTRENSELRLVVDSMNSDKEQMISLSEVETIMQQLDTIRKERDALTAQQESYTVQISELSSKVQSNEGERAEIESQLTQLRASLREVENQKQIEAAAASQRIDTLNTQVDKWKQEYEYEQANCQLLKKTIEEQELAVGQLKKEVRSMKDQEDDWKQVEALKNHEINVLTEQLRAALTSVEDLRLRCEMEEERRKMVEKQVLSDSELSNAIEMERSIRQRINEQLDEVTLENQKLRSTVQSNALEVVTLGEELSEVRHSYSEAQRTVTDLQQRVQQLESSNSESMERNKVLESERCQLTEQVESLKSMLSDMSALVEEKRVELEEYRTKHEQLSVQLSELQATSAKYHERETQLERQKDSMMETIQDQSNQLQLLSDQLSQSREANSQLDRQLEELLTHKNPKQKIHMINKIIQNNHDLKERVKQMEQQLQSKQMMSGNNKENEDGSPTAMFPLSTTTMTMATKNPRLNISALNMSSISSSGNNVVNNAGNLTPTNEEAASAQFARIEEVLKNVVRLYNAKRRKGDASKKATSYCRVMDMLESLEEEASNRGARGSTR